MRYLLVLNEGEPTTGLVILAQRPPKAESAARDEDDEEEEEEDEDAGLPARVQRRRGAVAVGSRVPRSSCSTSRTCPRCPAS